MGSSVVAQPPSLAFDTADPEFVASPWPRYEEIRRLGGLVYNEQVRRWMVSDFDTVKQILSAPERFGSERGLIEQAALFGGPTMEFYDGPHHDGIRGIWAGDFRARTLAALRPSIADIVRSRLAPVVDRLRAGQTVELVSELTRGIPTQVIADMLGVEPDMVDQFTEWSDAIGASAEGYTSPGERGRELIAIGKRATAHLNDYIRTRIGVRRCQPAVGADLIATMVRNDYACTHMTDQEIVANNTQLVFAGNETTAKLLAQIVVTLAAHPDQRHAIAADRSLIPVAVEEVHRHETISHSIFRDVVGEPQAVGGVEIPVDARITLLLGAANRDPKRWERASEFDVFRKKLSHIGFAFGLHSCLGMNLARLEAQVFLEEWLDAVADWTIEGPVDYGTNYGVRGPGRVLVTS